MMQSVEQTVSEIAQQWRQQGLKLLPGASQSALRDFESRFQVKCPPDFATYLLTFGGMPNGTMDEHLIRFWPLAEIQPVTGVKDTAAYANYFVFADYSISAHEYGICLSTAARPEVAVVGGPAPKPLASSFTEFLTMYLADPTSVFRM
jgi:hypothetical protein